MCILDIYDCKFHYLIYVLTDGVKQIILTAAKPLSAGKHAIVVEFNDANAVTLSIDGEKVAEETINARGKYLNSFSSEGVSVGKDLNSPVTKTYAAPFAFTGTVKTLVIDQAK